MTGNKGNRVKVTWSIDIDLVKQIKHKAIDEGTDASSIVEKAVKEWLEKKSDKMSIAAKKAWATRRESSETQ